MRVVEIDTRDRQKVREFLALPFTIYTGTPQWVPPLAGDARLALDRRRNPYFRHSEAAFFLVYGPGGDVLGRLAALDNHNYNEFNGSQTAFFYLFECQDQPEAAQALFDRALVWARERGLDQMVGPKGFSPLDGNGLLVRGFEHRPALGIPYNPPYYPTFIEAAGFEKKADILSGYLDRSVQFPPEIHLLADRVKARRGLAIARFRTRRDLRKLVAGLRALYNGALEEMTDTVPLTEAEARTIANQILWFADPSLIKIVMKDQEPVGFLFAYPDISAALQRTMGRLFPAGWITLLRELQTTTVVNINGMGLIRKYRGGGGSTVLFSELTKTLLESRYESAEIVQIAAENRPMLRDIERIGVPFHKTHRIYTRPIK